MSSDLPIIPHNALNCVDITAKVSKLNQLITLLTLRTPNTEGAYLHGGGDEHL